MLLYKLKYIYEGVDVILFFMHIPHFKLDHNKLWDMFCHLSEFCAWP